MNVVLSDIGRRFNRDWVFREVDYTFHAGERYAILGPNGSGKSTLLQVIAASLTPSKGILRYMEHGGDIPTDKVYPRLSIAAPYLQLIEEFTLREHIKFHFKHKGYLAGYSAERIVSRLGLEKAIDKQIANFSSGMKQRVKLAFACLSDTSMLLLDEPTSNLDQQGITWYQELIAETAEGRLLVIGSNQAIEYESCPHRLNLLDYKT